MKFPKTGSGSNNRDWFSEKLNCKVILVPFSERPVDCGFTLFQPSTVDLLCSDVISGSG